MWKPIESEAGIRRDHLDVWALNLLRKSCFSSHYIFTYRGKYWWRKALEALGTA
jgi:hypothetical protein